MSTDSQVHQVVVFQCVKIDFQCGKQTEENQCLNCDSLRSLVFSCLFSSEKSILILVMNFFEHIES